MKLLVSLFIFTSIVCSCSHVKEKVKQGAHKAGEAGGTVLKEVGSGVSEAFNISATLSEPLQQAGLALGKNTVSSDVDASDNILNLYVIFNKDFTGDVTVKVFDSKNAEMGRVKQTLTGKKDEARFFAIKFAAQTNIDTDSKITIEQ